MSAWCRVGVHQWRTYSVTLSEWPLHHGITLERCERCGARRRPR